METIDFKKDPAYKAKTEPEIVTIPKTLYVMVDGKGMPENSDGENTEFQEAMQILFGIVYTIKFWDKKYPAPPNYAKFNMAPLSGLWWMKNGQSFDMAKPDKWQWTVMLRVPEFVTPKYFNDVLDACIAQKKSEIYKKARLEYLDEGTCVQILHIGPYNTEAPNIEKMHAYAIDKGYTLTGKHHELYFGDPRRTAPEKLKTILRQPISKI